MSPGHSVDSHRSLFFVESCRSGAQVTQLDFETYPISPWPVGHVGPSPEDTIEEAFWRFHAENPQVYRELVSLARRAVRRGAKKSGSGCCSRSCAGTRSARAATTSG